MLGATTIPNFIWWYKNCRNWQFRVLEHLHLLRGNIVYKMRNGVDLKIRPYTNDADVIKEIYSGVPYTRILTLSKKPIIIDIGAHIGVFSTLAAVNYPQAMIFCFEPVCENFSYLKWNCSHNRGNFSLFNNAVCDRPGKRTINLNIQNPGNNSFYSKNESFFGKEIVVCTNLEEIISKNKINKIDLLKIDCEGSEYEILLKLPVGELKKIQNIVGELHLVGSHHPQEIYQLLRNHGFEVSMVHNNIIGTYLLTAKRKIS